MNHHAATFSKPDARNARHSYQHVAAIVNRPNRIMRGLDEGAQTAFASTLFHTVRALHAAAPSDC
jgi:hypothetical protein